MECGHVEALFLASSRQPDQGLCLQCFADVLTSSSSLVTHRAYALAEFDRLLEDDGFRSSLLRYHPHFLVPPLTESMSHCKDEELAKATVDAIMELCRSALCDGPSMLDDFILHFSTELSVRVIAWTRSQCYMIHAMGVLLELHSKAESCLPIALRCHDSFMPNLVSVLELPGDDVKGEVLFLFYKICSLDGGVELTLGYRSRIVHLTVTALLKTESDELRTNCVVLLAILARNGALTLGGQSTDDSKASTSVALFAEAMKGSLLSSGVQLQLASLQLICNLCAPGGCLSDQVDVLVDEGIADYVFEILRVSENLNRLSVVAIRALSIFSAARSVFSKHLAFGIDAVVRVLAYSAEAGFCPVQSDALLLLADGLADFPGVVNSIKALHILELLSRILRQLANSLEDSAGLGGDTPGSSSYVGTCMALESVLKLTCLSAVEAAPASQRVFQVVSDVLTCLSHGNFLQPDAIRYSASMLQQVFTFQVRATGDVCSLLELLEGELLPVLPRSIEVLVDEGAVSAIFRMLRDIIRKTTPRTAVRSFVKTLTSDRWISLAFASTGRFSSQLFREEVIDFVAALIDGFEDGEASALPLDLPTDPSDLLVLLERESYYNPNVLLHHCAIIDIMYASFSHSDRLVEEEQLLASLEHFVLLHAPILAETPGYSERLLRIVSVYLLARRDCISRGVAEAERLLVGVLEKDFTGDLFSEKNLPLLRDWVLSKESLRPICTKQLRKAFLSAATSSVPDSELEILHNVMDAEHGATAVVSVLSSVTVAGDENDFELVARLLRRILRSSTQLAKKLHEGGVAPVLHRWYILSGGKASAPVLVAFLELLAQLLLALTPETRTDYSSLSDILGQTVHFFTAKGNQGSCLAVSLLSLLCLFAEKSLEFSSLRASVEAMFMNKEICFIVHSYIVVRSTPKTDEEEQLLCLCLLFELYFSRCVPGAAEQFLDDMAVSMGHLCEILQRGPESLRVLSSSGLLQHVQRLEVQAGSFQVQVQALKSIVLLLQASTLDENEAVQINAAGCLSSLLMNKHSLGSEQRKELEYSPWYCFLAKEIMRWLSSPEEKPAESMVKVLVSMLQAFPAASWIRLIFSSLNLSALLANVSVDNLTYWKVALFLQLLRLGLLEKEHIRTVLDKVQSFRKAFYADGAAMQQQHMESLKQRFKEGAAVPLAWPETVKAIVNSVVLRVVLEAEAATGDVVKEIDEFLKQSQQGHVLG